MKDFMKLTFGIALVSLLMVSCEKTYDCQCISNINMGNNNIISDTSVVQAYSMLSKKTAEKYCDGASEQYVEDFNAVYVDDSLSTIECGLH